MQSWEQYIREEETKHWGDCLEAAGKAGFTSRQAEDECEDGSLRCFDCPWKNLQGEGGEDHGLHN